MTEPARDVVSTARSAATSAARFGRRPPADHRVVVAWMRRIGGFARAAARRPGIGEAAE